MIVYGTFLFVLLLSMAGLGIDGVRWFTLRANIQFATAAAASAAARQLDQKHGAIGKARHAAQDVAAANIAATLTDAFTTATITGVTFYAALPNSTTALDADAKFVKVTGTASTSSLPFTPFSTMSATATSVD